MTANTNRKQWSRKIEYVLTILGFLMGFGNLWRFPYICMKNGGGAFLIPYLFVIFIVIIPVYFLEESLGQFSGKSFRNVWSYCPLVKGLGLGMQVMLVPSVCYYVMLMTWAAYYLYSAFHNPLPWSTCANEWNTAYCFNIGNTTNNRLMNSTNDINDLKLVQDQVTSSTNTSRTSVTFPVMKNQNAAEEFWQYNVLDISTGIEYFGSLKGHIVICLALIWTVVYLCVINGITSTKKVVYVTATIPYLLLTILLVHNLTLPGSFDGVVFFIKPDFKSLLNIQVWLEAAIQVFHSMSIGTGLHITLASYNKFNNDCLRDAFVMTLAGEALNSLFGGFVIFTALGFMAHQANVSIKEVTNSGPGLGFVAYPIALAQMPLSNIWAVLFFFAMVILGVHSQFTSTEQAYNYFEECYPFMAKKPKICRGCLSLIGFVLTLPFCTQVGVYLFQLFDWYNAAFAPLFFVLVECISVAWLYGAERYSKDVEMMIGRKVPRYIKFLWSCISPFFLLVLMINSLVSYDPPTYGEYAYPNLIKVAGLVFSVLPIIPLLLNGINTVFHSPGKSIYKKLLSSIRPTEDWHPKSLAVDYLKLSWDTSGTLLQRILVNIGLKESQNVS